MVSDPACGAGALVALLAEGVDRNKMIDTTKAVELGRPPRGGRG